MLTAGMKYFLGLALASTGTALVVDSTAVTAAPKQAIPSPAGKELDRVPPASFSEVEKEKPFNALPDGPIGLYLPASVDDWRQY